MSVRRAATETERDPILATRVALSVDYDSADDFIIDCSDHAASGEMFLSTDQELEVGERVELVFSFPGLHKPAACSGVVRYRRGGRGDDRGLGIQLDDAADREQLARTVAAVRERDPRVVARLVRVLVVEDNPHVAQLIRSGLHGSGKRTFGVQLAFNFWMAQNGREALELIAGEQFDALIIDIYLPVLDGVHVISEIRADERLRDLPIIAVSAGGDGACDAALEAGADRFVHKPMRLRQILDAMRELVPLDG